VKAIQQLIEHFQAEGALSAAQIDYLVHKGFLPPLVDEESEYDTWEPEEEGFEEAARRLQAPRAKDRRKRNAEQPRPCVRRWWKEQVERLRQARQGK
jgi:hypothetical protein